MRVLILQPEPLLRHVLARRLEADGHTVRAFSDEEAALQALEEDHPDACVVTATGPGAHALAPCRQMRVRLGGEMPIVLLVHGRLASDRRAGLEAGADVVVTMPVDPDEVTETLAVAQRQAAWR